MEIANSGDGEMTDPAENGIGMAERKPARDSYDVVIDLGAGERGSYACAIVKLAYHLGANWGPCMRAPAVGLENDIRDPNLEPRIPPHSDFWPHRYYVDVGVAGSAYAPRGQPAQQMRAGIEIGQHAKYVDVIGDRTVEWTQTGRPRISAAEPFVEMPLDHRHAYGGVDFRVPFDPSDPRAVGVSLNADHPGLYPRNPWGTGYIAMPDPLDGFKLPNLEDPNDRLTDDRVIAEPAAWFRQPMPWYLDWMPVNCFPRNLFITIDCEPWFPPPDDVSLPEVRFGLLPAGYRDVLTNQALGMPPSWQFHQEASPGLVLAEPPYGAPLRLVGMHPQRPVIECTVPHQPPVVDMIIENETERVESRLMTVAIYPDQDLLTMVYAARKDTPRPFIPGIHGHIPIAVAVDGDTPVVYEPPPTVKQRLRAAEEASKQ